MIRDGKMLVSTAGPGDCARSGVSEGDARRGGAVVGKFVGVREIDGTLIHADGTLIYAGTQGFVASRNVCRHPPNRGAGLVPESVEICVLSSA